METIYEKIKTEYKATIELSESEVEDAIRNYVDSNIKFINHSLKPVDLEAGIDNIKIVVNNNKIGGVIVSVSAIKETSC